MTEPAGDPNLHAVVLGGGDRSPLIFLHGFGAGAFVWEPMQAAFADERPTLAYWLPGHGRSSDADGTGSAGHMARAITHDLRRRGIGRAHFVGHSMGGAVAAKIALGDPHLAASLTLLAPGGFGPEMNHRLLGRYALAREPDALMAALENMFGWNAEIPDELVAGLAEARRVPGAAERLQTILSAILVERDGLVTQGTIGRDVLSRLTMPVKVLWGTQDRVLPTRQAHRLPPLFAAHVFEDTGHMLIEERPSETMLLVRQNIRAADAD